MGGGAGEDGGDGNLGEGGRVGVGGRGCGERQQVVFGSEVELGDRRRLKEE